MGWLSMIEMIDLMDTPAARITGTIEKPAS
jgi:hypothetical protein